MYVGGYLPEKWSGWNQPTGPSAMGLIYMYIHVHVPASSPGIRVVANSLSYWAEQRGIPLGTRGLSFSVSTITSMWHTIPARAAGSVVRRKWVLSCSGMGESESFMSCNGMGECVYCPAMGQGILQWDGWKWVLSCNGMGESEYCPAMGYQ